MEEVLAQLLSAEGFSTIDDLAFVSLEELSSIEGLDEDVARELISRAQELLAEKNKSVIKDLYKLGVDKELMELFGGLSTERMLDLANAGIKQFEDLAEMTVEEFKEILPNSNMEDVHIRSIIDQAKSKVESQG